MMGRRISSLTMELAENCTYTRVLNDRAEAVDDATAGMIIVILLFVLPSSLSFWPFVERTKLFRLFFLLSKLLSIRWQQCRDSPATAQWLLNFAATKILKTKWQIRVNNAMLNSYFAFIARMAAKKIPHGRCYFSLIILFSLIS